MRLYHSLKRVSPIAKLVDDFITNREKRIFEVIKPFLNKKDNILDIGSGTGHTAQGLINKGYKKVKCVDYCDMNVCPHTKPVLYNGKKLPFKNNEFKVALLITVLHHTPNPELIIKEASRVAKRIIIMEDTYKNIWQKYATFVMDSVGNMEFKGHPHTNKTDVEWRILFKKNNLKMTKKQSGKFLWFFESTTYFLERE